MGWAKPRHHSNARSSRHVQVFSGNPGNKMEWVELDLDGKLTVRWRLDEVAQVGAIAFTSDDQAYLPHFDLVTKTHQVLKLNHATSTWEKVPSPGLCLYGSDGDRLVFAEWGGHGWDGLMHLSWFKQPELQH